MLTEREQEWLERREEMPGYYCLWCPLWDDEADCDGRSPHPFCPIFQRRERLWDAAMFSERVAAKLARYAVMQSQQYGCEDCVCTKAGVCYDGIKKECVEIFLQTARIKVEEEMDNEP